MPQLLFHLIIQKALLSKGSVFCTRLSVVGIGINGFTFFEKMLFIRKIVVSLQLLM